MNIFYDHTIFRQPYGGISRYFRELAARLLNADDTNIHLFMGLFSNRYGLEKMTGYAVCRGWPSPGIRYTGRLCNFISDLGWWLFQAKFAKNGGTGCLYHPTYYNFSGLPRAKTVFTVHDFTHERYPHLFPKRDSTPRLKKKAFGRADALICVSESTKNDLLALYPSIKCHIETIHQGYNDLSSCAGADISLPDRPYFLFVGARHEYKNFGLLLKAFASSEALKKNFGIVCFGGSNFSAHEKKRFAELGVAEKITRFGGGDDVLAALYKNAEALVYPSVYEGFGVPPLEAMSCGCPVVASGVSSIPEVAGGAALLFDPASAEELAFRLQSLTGGKELRTGLIEAGHRRRALFSWDLCAEETLRVYEKLLK